MKKIENKRKYIGIALIVVIIIIVMLKVDIAKKLIQFDIIGKSSVDKTPILIVDEDDVMAIFKFNLVGIENDEFFDKYEIESIKINGQLVANSECYYDDCYDEPFLEINSLNYKPDNEIEIIIRDKNSDKKYLKKLAVETKYIM
jgi:hypothetical protein